MRSLVLSYVMGLLVSPGLLAVTVPADCAGCVADVTTWAGPDLTAPPAGCLFSVSISVVLEGHPETCTGTTGNCSGDPCDGSWSLSWAASCPAELCSMIRGIPSIDGGLVCETIQPGADSSASSGTLLCGGTVSLQVSLGDPASDDFYAYAGKQVECSACK